jgi:hypothetical protein
MGRTGIGQQPNERLSPDARRRTAPLARRVSTPNQPRPAAARRKRIAHRMCCWDPRQESALPAGHRHRRPDRGDRPDLVGRRLVGWTVADHLETDPVGAARTDALVRRRPADGLIFHPGRRRRESG